MTYWVKRSWRQRQKKTGDTLRPFNCTREWWKVTSGTTSIEVLQWKEEMAELRKAHERRAEINAVERSAKKMGLVHSLHYLNGEAGGANYVEMGGLDDKQR
jgi:hypothetical protein